MKVVTHNILKTLNEADALKCVHTALASRPQIVGFQEFEPAYLDALQKLNLYKVIHGHASILPVLIKKAYLKKLMDVRTVTLVDSFPGGRPTPATEVIFENRYGVKIAVLNTHPLAHHDKPSYKAAWQKAISESESWIAKMKGHNFVPVVTMDGNGAFLLSGLTNCWEGHAKKPTGPGGNTIDCVWTIKKADAVETFTTPSDHNGVLATYTNFLNH